MERGTSKYMKPIKFYSRLQSEGKGVFTEQKAKIWLKEHKLAFEEVSIQRVTRDDIIHLLQLSDDGFESIISKRSSLYKNFILNGVLSPSMTLTECIELVLKYPALIRTPIIMDDKKLQVGFNEDSMRKFIPRPHRKVYRNFSMR
ncbi:MULTISPECIES: ArsC/Spx/MgsR family protein [Lactococcus]|jgi:regulatory protein spx|uniref:Transcriptional regulator Spx n=1 Tax=Lactococcus formosensis TaxID=1281486 RepID=A0A9Q8Y332_9LACT|nr:MULTISPECIES: ArsC/Spx/MgsR family protein [Lactococcus]USI66535.1 transcriptional regulator Spx [Lactococcus petauri]USI68978.1 transcriptional regulator Spx [Lactococcus petauri]USJ21167.1 transcriptional regulator Spx [Lactococcus formosensis]WJE13646.1 ArsC/Spx/MgsR family protein [Lactococcus petauri]